MWYAIIGALLASFLGGLIYISFRAARFRFIRSFSDGKQAAARLIRFTGFVCLTAVLGVILNLMNALVCMVHLVLFWMICDFAAFLIYQTNARSG